jgi:flagellar basal-body rod protein FlgF
MENSIYLALSRQIALRTNMDAVSNNIANMNTTGYRGQNVMFEEYISDPRYNDDEVSFVINHGQYQTTAPGPLKYTGNQLDVAVAGPGYMGIQGPGGEVMYSRAGQFQIDAAGVLADPNGRAVASAGGANIIIPAGSTEVKIDETGAVSNQNGQLGQIMMVEFANVQELEAVGNNLYRTDAAPQPAAESRMKQGHLEGSNVNSITEMTKMIETLRTYQSVQNVLKTENERLRGAIQKLTGQ